MSTKLFGLDVTLPASINSYVQDLKIYSSKVVDCMWKVYEAYPLLTISVGAYGVFLLLKKFVFGGTYCPKHLIESSEMAGKVAILTGGNSGLGLCLAQQLAVSGVKVILAVRNPQRGLLARSKIVQFIKRETNVDPPLDCVQVYHCDLSSLENVREFVTSIQIMLSGNPRVKKVVNQVGVELVTETQETFPVIDFLINNAGSIYPRHGLTVNGIESHFGGNYLGHFYLTNLLLKNGLMKDNCRILNIVSSPSLFSDEIYTNHDSLYEFSALDLLEDGKLKFDPQQLYMRSKYALYLFSIQLQRELNQKHLHGHFIPRNAQIFSIFPGPTETSSVNKIYSPFVRILTKPLKVLMLKSPWQGIQCALYCLVEHSSKLKGGEYYEECRHTPQKLTEQDENRMLQLWNVSHQLIQNFEEASSSSSESLCQRQQHSLP